jgi:hypothetical protein
MQAADRSVRRRSTPTAVRSRGRNSPGRA